MAGTGYVYSYGGSSGSRRKKGGFGKRRFLFLLIVILAGAGFYYWKYYRKGETTPQKVEQSQPPPTTPPETRQTTAEIDISDISVDPVKVVDTSETRKEVEKIEEAPAPPPPPAPVKKTLDENDLKLKQICDDARLQLEKGEYSKAKEMILEVLKTGIGEDHPLWRPATRVLSDANTKIMTTDVPSPEKALYTIKTGDSLDRIARDFNTTVEAIQHGNALDPNRATIYPGNTLRIFSGDWWIRVSKSKFRLYLYNGKQLFKVYDVGIGKQNRTPIGTFEIVDKVKNPDWEYRGKKYPFGAPENVLGTRWMRIRPTGTTNKDLRGYGIHGTWVPESIGKSESNGCIRMKNSDVEELYSLIPKYKNKDGEYVEVVIEK